jgi:hypothetical protein
MSDPDLDPRDIKRLFDSAVDGHLANPAGLERIRRGYRRRRTIRQVTAATIAALALSAIGLAVANTLHGGGQSVRVIGRPSPSTTSPTSTATTTPSTTTATTKPPTSTTPPSTVPLSEASAQLDAYLSAEASGDHAAARAAGQPWNGYLHTPPVNDAGSLIAVAAFSYDPNAKPVQVVSYSNGRWVQSAALPAPVGSASYVPGGAAMNAYWLAYYPGSAISVADVTRDGRPDFLIPLNAADNVPGVVVSQDGGPGGSGWRYVPYTQGSSTARFYTFARAAQFRGNTLVTTYDNCNPNCAQGANYTITWTYERTAGAFWAPSPP